jgi:hypothetical protein
LDFREMQGIHLKVSRFAGILDRGFINRFATQSPSDVLSCPLVPSPGAGSFAELGNASDGRMGARMCTGHIEQRRKGLLAKARRRGGYVLLTMSTPAPALVITTPAVAGGALLMISEAMHDRATQVRGGRLPSEKPLLALERAVD